MQKQSFILAALCAASGASLAADDTDLAAIRAQIAEMKQSYEARIAALEKKLAQAEAHVEATANSASPTPVLAPRQAERAPATAASGFNPEVSLIVQGQYRQTKDVADRNITGFWPAAGHVHAGDPADSANRRGFSIDHTELVLGASIDPYWHGRAILAMRDGEVEVEEAWFQSSGLGHGLGLKGGRFRSGIGYLNEQHPHQWDFAGAPLMYQVLFGEHGSYAQDGVQFKWLAPTETFLELGAEVGRGATFPGSERNRNGAGAATLFAHVGDDVGVEHSWRAGLGYLSTRAKDRAAEISDAGGDAAEALFTGASRTWIADFVWKWAPDGNPKYRNFKLQAEYFNRRETGDIFCQPETGGVGLCNASADAYRSRQSGWYAQGVYQFTPNWRAGLRYDQLNSGAPHIGALAAAQIGEGNAVFQSFNPRRSTAMVDYSWSEFSRIRLQLARDQSMPGITDNQLTLQYIMSLGAHGAHKY